ncbi:MAG: hypothetical protein ACTSRP_15250 [Candidatus Helarchaeota archaeon]
MNSNSNSSNKYKKIIEDPLLIYYLYKIYNSEDFQIFSKIDPLKLINKLEGYVEIDKHTEHLHNKLKKLTTPGKNFCKFLESQGYFAPFAYIKNIKDIDDLRTQYCEYFNRIKEIEEKEKIAKKIEKIENIKNLELNEINTAIIPNTNFKIHYILRELKLITDEMFEICVEICCPICKKNIIYKYNISKYDQVNFEHVECTEDKCTICFTKNLRNWTIIPTSLD